MNRYDASAITVLKGLEAVRRRPAMYIGSTGPQGVYNLVVEVVQNAVDEALAGHCHRIDVTIGTDGSVAVEDDGRGIPVDVHPRTGRIAAEIVLTELHAGSKFTDAVYSTPGGLHGVGLSCVNALSAWLEVGVGRNGESWTGRFERGEVAEAIHHSGDARQRGTRIRFLPDPQIFGGAHVSDAQLVPWLQAMAFLHPGLDIHFVDRRTGLDETWKSDAGLAGFVAHLNRNRQLVHPDPVHLSGRHEGVDVDVAMQWTREFHEHVQSYVNSVFTAQGGTHVEGLRAALTRAVNHYATQRRLLDESIGERIAGYDIREGLTCVLSVRRQEPEFEGQTKTLLTSADVEVGVEKVIGEQFLAWLEAHPDHAAAIVGRALEASRARAASRRASERARYQRVDFRIDKEIYQQQFGIRSKNWHDSARWLTDKQLLGLHAEMTKVSPDGEALDVCCGSGVVGNSFRGRVKKITGLDITPEMVALSRQRLDEVVQGDVYDIPFPNERFDLVCNREVLHLLPHPERPVSEIFRVLKPGGQFIFGQWVPFSEVDAPWMFRIVKKKQPLFFNNLMEEDCKALLRDAGFVDIETKEYLQWEDIDLWIDTWETPNLHRHQIRDLYHHAPAEVRAVHPFEISPSGAITDCWRWVVFSAMKPSHA
ncbi:MAG: methyltransferase domain-containing protein [Myxococcota bacterium]